MTKRTGFPVLRPFCWIFGHVFESGYCLVCDRRDAFAAISTAARFWLAGIMFMVLFALAGWLAVAITRGPV